MSDMRKCMKVGLIHFMAYPETMRGDGPILETLEKILADDYFDFIEVAWIKDRAIRERVVSMLKQAHIEVGYGASPRLLTTGLNLNSLNEDIRKRAVATLCEGIDEAREYGAKGFGFLSGKYDEQEKEAAFEALKKSIRELSEKAKSVGDMRLFIEIFDYDIDKKSLIGPTSLAKRLAEELCELDNFGLMVDLSHIPLMHETIDEAIDPIKQYIWHAHMGNCVLDPLSPAYGDAHPRFGYPGGCNDVDELCAYLKKLREIGYLSEQKPGIVSFEVKPMPGESPELVIANAKRALNAAIKRC